MGAELELLRTLALLQGTWSGFIIGVISLQHPIGAVKSL